MPWDICLLGVLTSLSEDHIEGCKPPGNFTMEDRETDVNCCGRTFLLALDFFSGLNECCSRGTVECSCQHNIVSESQAECYSVEMLNTAKINPMFLDHASAKEL